MNMSIEWEDNLPPSRRGKSRDPVIAQFAQALREQPGRWARYPNNDQRSKKYLQSLASHITSHSGAIPVELKHGFEGAFREGVLFVRALPEGEQ